MNRKHVHIYKKRMKATAIIMLIIGILYGMYISRTTYQIEVPQLKKIKSIVLIQKKTIQELTNQDAIADIATLLKGKKTQQESMNNTPFNVSQKIRLEFHSKYGDITFIYLYKKDNQYYTEEPYNGIYQMSENEYNSITRYLR